MKSINQIAEAALKNSQTSSTKSQSEPSKPTGLPIEWISALFKRFQARYGHKFQSAMEGIEEMAVTEWSQGLGGMTGQQIKRGLDAWKGEWPPSLPEFRAACEGSDDWEHKGEAYKEAQRALPRPKCKAEIVEAHREKMRKLGFKIPCSNTEQG